MKRNLLMAAILLTAVLCSCKKEGVKLFHGRYGFTVSGSLTCEYRSIGPDGSSVAATRKFILANEQGVMHVEPNGDAMVVTMKDIGSGVVVYEATASGRTISISKQPRRAEIITGYVTVGEQELLPRLKTIDVNVTGSGYRTNDLMVINMQYTGDDFEVIEQKDTVKYHIVASDVRCVATAEK